MDGSEPSDVTEPPDVEVPDALADVVDADNGEIAGERRAAEEHTDAEAHYATHRFTPRYPSRSPREADVRRTAPAVGGQFTDRATQFENGPGSDAADAWSI